MWWEYHGLGNKLFILMVTEVDDIIGFCPLMKVPSKGYEEIRFIGGDEASYMNFILRKESRKKAIESIIDYLMGIEGNFLNNIHGFFKDSDEYSEIKEYIRKIKWDFLETSLECYFTIIDGQDFNSYMKTQFSRSRIHTMKRKKNRLGRLGEVSFKPFTGIQEDIETIFDIHDKRWQRKIGSSKFSEGKTREFFKELALSKEMPFKTSLDTIDINNKPISFIYGFKYNGRYIFYRIAHDDNFAIFSPGEIVLREKIRDCFDKKLKIFDFGAGYEPYKTAWGTMETDVVSFIFPSNSRFAKMVFIAYKLRWNIKQSLKKKTKVYNFIKYEMGKIKFFFYPENAKAAIKRGLRRSREKMGYALTYIYWTDNYYIMRKHLRHLQQAEHEIYRVDEVFLDKLDLLLEITKMESSDILRRFLKGDRCILVYTHQGMHCLWFNDNRVDITEIGYSWLMDKNSIFIYEISTNVKKKKIDEHILYSALLYLKGKGYDKCYLLVKERETQRMRLVKGEGFKKFRHLKFQRRFGRASCSEYKENRE